MNPGLAFDHHPHPPSQWSYRQDKACEATANAERGRGTEQNQYSSTETAGEKAKGNIHISPAREKIRGYLRSTRGIDHQGAKVSGGPHSGEKLEHRAQSAILTYVRPVRNSQCNIYTSGTPHTRAHLPRARALCLRCTGVKPAEIQQAYRQPVLVCALVPQRALRGCRGESRRELVSSHHHSLSVKQSRMRASYRK